MVHLESRAVKSCLSLWGNSYSEDLYVETKSKSGVSVIGLKRKGGFGKRVDLAQGVRVVGFDQEGKILVDDVVGPRHLDGRLEFGQINTKETWILGDICAGATCSVGSGRTTIVVTAWPQSGLMPNTTHLNFKFPFAAWDYNPKIAKIAFASVSPTVTTVGLTSTDGGDSPNLKTLELDRLKVGRIFDVKLIDEDRAVAMAGMDAGSGDSIKFSGPAQVILIDFKTSTTYMLGRVSAVWNRFAMLRGNREGAYLDPSGKVQFFKLALPATTSLKPSARYWMNQSKLEFQ